jgi:hypothetical protein
MMGAEATTTPAPARPNLATVELTRLPARDLWCFGCRKRLTHADLLLDHADPGRRSPYLGPWWARQCSGCGKNRTYFPGCGPL